MFFNCNSFVLRYPVTSEYSQLRMPKKSAPVASWPIAFDSSVLLLFHSFLNMLIGRHFCVLEYSPFCDRIYKYYYFVFEI